MNLKRIHWKKVLLNTAWVLAGIAAMVLLGAAMQQKSRKPCTDIKIDISGVERQMFIDEKDILEIINSGGGVKGAQTGQLNLQAMETLIEKNPWVSNAEIFINNEQVLELQIVERQPVARVFTLEGNSFYLDSGSLRLPLSDKVYVKLPVFTGFPSDKAELAKPDSLLLNQIVKMSQYILADSFWMAQVAQVMITPKAEFELIPVIGDQVLVMGNADNLDRKFGYLHTFYQDAWLQNGMNTYEKLDVQYANQLVAVKKGSSKAALDSATLRMMIDQLSNASQVSLFDTASGKPALNSSVSAKDSIKNSSGKMHPDKEKINSKTSAKTNNKKEEKSLSGGVKSNPTPPVKKKPPAKSKKPKAQMIKTS
ncbi:MAG: hypothetical protein RLZZ28_1417 [Bacteroidota bacterium]|jgi:cell division protein FtsQ